MDKRMEPPPAVDRDLWSDSTADRDAAFRRLFEAYSPLVFSIARRHLPVTHAEEAYDVLIDVFSALYREIDRRRERMVEVNLPAYLKVVTRNRSIDHYRSIKRFDTSRVPLEEAENVPDTRLPDPDLTSVLEAEVERALAQLSESDRLIIRAVLENQTFPEIATNRSAVEGRTVSVAGTRKAYVRALTRLRNVLVHGRPGVGHE